MHKHNIVVHAESEICDFITIQNLDSHIVYEFIRGHTSKFIPITPKLDFTLTPHDSDRISCENEILRYMLS